MPAACFNPPGRKASFADSTSLLLRELPPHPPALRFGDDIACTLSRATAAGMIPSLGVIEAVVVSQFLPRHEVAQGHDPDSAPNILHLAIRRARMVDVSRRIPRHVAVDVVPLGHLKNIDATVLAC